MLARGVSNGAGMAMARISQNDRLQHVTYRSDHCDLSSVLACRRRNLGNRLRMARFLRKSLPNLLFQVARRQTNFSKPICCSFSQISQAKGQDLWVEYSRAKAYVEGLNCCFVYLVYRSQLVTR